MKELLDLGISNGVENTVKELLHLLEEEGWSIACKFFQYEYLQHTAIRVTIPETYTNSE